MNRKFQNKPRNVLVNRKLQNKPRNFHHVRAACFYQWMHGYILPISVVQTTWLRLRDSQNIDRFPRDSPVLSCLLSRISIPRPLFGFGLGTVCFCLLLMRSSWLNSKAKWKVIGQEARSCLLELKVQFLWRKTSLFKAYTNYTRLSCQKLWLKYHLEQLR